MRKFQPVQNATITQATDPHQAECIVEFLNRHTEWSFYVQGECVVIAKCIKPSLIAYVQGIITGHLLTK